MEVIPINNFFNILSNSEIALLMNIWIGIFTLAFGIIKSWIRSYLHEEVWYFMGNYYRILKLMKEISSTILGKNELRQSIYEKKRIKPYSEINEEKLNNNDAIEQNFEIFIQHYSNMIS
jgi:hypothetical protein